MTTYGLPLPSFGGLWSPEAEIYGPESIRPSVLWPENGNFLGIFTGFVTHHFVPFVVIKQQKFDAIGLLTLGK